jgi:hypothetical protein
MDGMVTLDGFRCELDHVPGWVENMEAIRGAIRRKVETAVEDAIGSALPPFLENAFADVLPNDPITIMGVPLEVRSQLGDLQISDGGMYAAVDLAAWSASPLPDRAAVGYMQLGDRSPPTSSSADVVLDVALDTVNMATFAAWSAGIFQRRIDSVPFGDGVLTVGALGLLAPGIGGDVMAPDAPVAILIDFALPPVVSPESGSVRLHAADVRVELIAVVDGRDQSLGTLSVGISAPVTPSIAGGALTVGIGDLTIVGDPVGDGPRGLPKGERLDTLLNDLAGTFAGALPEFGGITVPSVGGFTLAPAGFVADGGWITFEGDLLFM